MNAHAERLRAKAEAERALPASERLLNMLRATHSTPEANALLDAFRAEVLEKAADRLTNTNPDRSAEFSDGVDWAVDTLLALVSEGGESRG